jgi:OOP family OmpA-OmpF porin
MNYSTLKKTVVLSFASLMAVGAASAQTTSTDSTMKMKTTTETTTPKVFGGRGQYRTWNVGVNAGILSPFSALGGTNTTTNADLQLGYGISIRKQLAHSFGLELDVMRGNVAGNNSDAAPTGVRNGVVSYNTELGYVATLNGVVNVATIDYLRRKNAINFFLSAGGGLMAYAPKTTFKNVTTGVTTVVDKKNVSGTNGNNTYAKELVIPVGAGVKFRLSDRVALNFGYNLYFMDGDNLDGAKARNGNPGYYLHKDKFSYGYGGLEFNLGSASKPNLDWVNPVALMYDELNDPTLRQEVEALKGRVTNVEKAVDDLKKDSDGDGVADQFDKCPGTPAGTVVDGSGCPIKFPAPDTTAKAGMAPAAAATPYANIQFEFDSSVLRTSSYPILDATSADLRANAGKKVMVNGYASSEGTAAHNLRLSTDRANSVKTYLVNSGVDAKRLKVKGMGETHPVADNSTEEGRVLNRRVEFKTK